MRHSYERWCFVCDIRMDGEVPSHVIARRLLKVLLRRWGIRCKGLSVDRRMFDLMEENKRLQGIIDGMAARIAQQSELLSRHAKKRDSA